MLKIIGSVLNRFVQFLLILLILLIVFIVYCVYYFDPNNYKDLIVKQIEQTTGSKVQLKGDVKIKIFPEPHVELKDSIFTIKANENDITFMSNHLDFDLALEPLLKKDFQLTAVFAEEVKIIISQNGKIQNEIAFDKFKSKIKISPPYLKLSHFSLMSAKNMLQGNIVISPNGQKINMTGDISSESWSISEGKKSSDITLTDIVQSLRPFEMAIAVKMNNLYYDKTHFKNVKFNVTSANNNIKLEPTLDVAKGVMSGEINLQPAASTTKLSFDLKLKQGEALEVLKMLNQEGAQVKGKSDVAFRGNTMGNTLSEWQAGLSGTLIWRFQEVNFEQTKNNPVKGDLTVLFAKGKAKNIKGNLSANNWQIEESTNAKGLTHPVADLLSSLTSYNLSFGVKINSMQFKRALFKNVQFLLTSENKVLKFNPSADFANGKLTSRFTVRPAKENSKINFIINVKNANVPEVINSFGENKHIISGKLNLDLKGNTVGADINKWKANLSGNMLLNLTNARLHPNARHIIQQLGEVFNCIVMKSKITEGIIRGQNNLGFDSSSLSGLGSGQYNLRTNQLNYIFQMVTNDKINPLNVGGTIHTIKVTGSLEDPSAKLASEEIMRQGSRIALGIATGGYSLLVEKLRDVLIQSKSPCQVVLESP